MTEVVKAPDDDDGADAAASWMREERWQVRVRRPPYGSEEAGEKYVHADADAEGRGEPAPLRRRSRGAPAADASRAESGAIR